MSDLLEQIEIYVEGFAGGKANSIRTDLLALYVNARNAATQERIANALERKADDKVPADVGGFEEWWTDLYGAPHPNGPSQENKDFAELGWDNAIQALLKEAES